MNFNWFDNPVVRGLGRLADFVLLNLLWLLCSIPIITIGASTTALYTVMLKIVKNEEGYVVKGFFKAFKENFKQGTVIWLVFLALGILLIVDFFSLRLMPVNIAGILQMLFLLMGALILGGAVYAFGLQARFINTVKNTLKNAVILMFAKLPYTILIVIISVGSVIVTFLTERTLMIGITVWMFFGVALVAWLNCLILRHIFGKLEEPQEEQKHDSV